MPVAGKENKLKCLYVLCRPTRVHCPKSECAQKCCQTSDFTPSGGNPAVYSYTFLKDSVPVTEGVSGPVLTINPVVRSSRGVYTCTANNTAGTAVVTRNLFVVGDLVC